MKEVSSAIAATPGGISILESATQIIRVYLLQRNFLSRKESEQERARELFYLEIHYKEMLDILLGVNLQSQKFIDEMFAYFDKHSDDDCRTEIAPLVRELFPAPQVRDIPALLMH